MEEEIPEEAQEAFDKAMKNFEGAENYTAIQLAESQVVAGMEAGSVIEVDDNYVTVEFMEEGEFVRRYEDGTEEKVATLYINKGEAEEHYFVANEGGTWITVMPDDHIGIIKIGEATLPFSDTLTFTDMTKNPGESVDVPFEELKDYMETMKDSYMSFYGALNTKIEVENGEIVSIVRTWMP